MSGEVGEKRECPICGPTSSEPHPRRPGIVRCANCKEWLVAQNNSLRQSVDAYADRLMRHHQMSPQWATGKELRVLLAVTPSEPLTPPTTQPRTPAGSTEEATS